MASYNGNQAAFFVITNGGYANGFESKTLVPTIAKFLFGAVAASTKTDTQPVDELPRSVNGNALELYGFLHFYDHIHFQYPILNLGNILGGQTLSFWIFNAFFTTQTLQSINRTGSEDLFIDPSDDDTPITFQPFEQKYFQLSINSSGPPSVDVNYLFDFGFREYDLHVFGNRLVLFPFRPQSDIEETLEFSTAIETSDNENEQRAKLRNPRQRFSYKVLLDDNEAAFLQSLLFDWQNRIFGVPVWFEARFPNAGIPIGSTSFSVDTDSADFRINGQVFIYELVDGEPVFEAFAISNIESGTINIQSQTTNAYSTRAMLMPIRDCYIGNNVGRDRYPMNATDATASFVSLTNVDLSNVVGWNVYDSKLYLNDPNLMDGDTKGYSLDRSVGILDNKTGAVWQYSKAEMSRIRTTKVWNANTRQQVWKVRQLLHYLTGRKSFFIPTGMHDFELLQPIAAAGTTLRVKNAYYSSFVRNRRPLGDLRLIMNDGTEYVRRITQSTREGADEVLSVNTFFDPDNIIEVEDVERIELVMLMRIDRDQATITHRSVGRASISAGLVSVKQ